MKIDITGSAPLVTDIEKYRIKMHTISSLLGCGLVVFTYAARVWDNWVSLAAYGIVGLCIFGLIALSDHIIRDLSFISADECEKMFIWMNKYGWVEDYMKQVIDQKRELLTLEYYEIETTIKEIESTLKKHRLYNA